jgi:hypothetical protein
MSFLSLALMGIAASRGLVRSTVVAQQNSQVVAPAPTAQLPKSQLPNLGR